MYFRGRSNIRFELLEDRCLLAGDIYTTAPIADIRQLAAIFGR